MTCIVVFGAVAQIMFRLVSDSMHDLIVLQGVCRHNALLTLLVLKFIKEFVQAQVPYLTPADAQVPA